MGDKVEGLDKNIKGLCDQFTNQFANLADLIISNRQSSESSAALPKQQKDTAASSNSSTSSAGSSHSRSSVPAMLSPDAHLGMHNNFGSPLPSYSAHAPSPQFYFNFSGSK